MKRNLLQSHFWNRRFMKKAVEQWKDDVRRAFSSFRNPLFDKLIIAGDLRKKLDTGDHATLQSELSGDYSYNEQETFLRCLCSNYDETKKRTIKEYEQRNTDMILNSLSSLGDYLNDNRGY